MNSPRLTKQFFSRVLSSHNSRRTHTTAAAPRFREVEPSHTYLWYGGVSSGGEDERGCSVKASTIYW